MTAPKIKERVNNTIAGKKVVIFTKVSCGYCAKAKRTLLEHRGKDFPASEWEEFKLDGHPNMSQIQRYLGDLTGAKSVPRVFINGKCIGGSDETAKLERTGKLAGLLKADKDTSSEGFEKGPERTGKLEGSLTVGKAPSQNMIKKT